MSAASSVALATATPRTGPSTPMNGARNSE